MISAKSQTENSEDNTKSLVQVSEDPHLKCLTNLKLMYKSEIESCIKFLKSGTDCGEDSELLEETLVEIEQFRGRSTTLEFRNF